MKLGEGHRNLRHTTRSDAGGGHSPLSGNLSSPVGEKWTVRRGIFTDEHIYILYQLWAVVIDLVKKDDRLFPSCQI